MCGRYYVDGTVIKEISRMAESPATSLRQETPGGMRDVCPSQRAVVLRAERGGMEAEEMRWGFPGFQGNSLIINIRSESALDKRISRDSILHRRCVIPAKGFYEWNKSKEKFTFESRDSSVLFLAGCFDRYENGHENRYENGYESRRPGNENGVLSREEKRFVILTTQARGNAAPVHERMPLILRRDEVGTWLYDDTAAERLLGKTPDVPLECRTDYEQMRLF